MSNLSTYPTTMTPSHDNAATVVTIERSGKHQGKDKNSARDRISGNGKGDVHRCINAPAPKTSLAASNGKVNLG